MLSVLQQAYFNLGMCKGIHVRLHTSDGQAFYIMTIILKVIMDIYLKMISNIYIELRF